MNQPEPNPGRKLAPLSEPWTLLRDAIDDLEIQEKDPRYVIDMGSWHNQARVPDKPGQRACHQCLAGAVMTQRLGADLKLHYDCNDFGANAKRALHFLDNMRDSGFGHAWRILSGESIPGHLEELLYDAGGGYCPTYATDPDAFKARLLRLADVFEKYLKDEK